MATGTVKWFNDKRGYGFIVPDRGGSDVFVHYTGIAGGGHKTLAEGARVEYELRAGRRGSEAFNVVRLDGQASTAPESNAPQRPKRRGLLSGRQR